MFNTGFWITYLSAIISVYILIMIFKRISRLNLRLSNINTIILNLISAFIIATNNLYNYNILKFLSTFIIVILVEKISFKQKYNDTIYYSFWIMGFLLIIDTIFGVISIISASNIVEYNNNYLYKYFYSIMIAFLLNKSFYNVRLLNAINKIHETFKNKTNIYLYFFLILAFLNILYALYTFNFLDIKYYITVIIFVLSIISFNYLFYHFYYNNNILRIKNECLQNNIYNAQQSLEDYKLLKHNLLNDLSIIRSAVYEEKDFLIMKTIEKYDKESFWINNLNYIPSGIQGIIYSKINLLNRYNAEIYIDNKLPKQLDNLALNTYYDLCEAISIILDNAIEAVKESQKKVIYFKIYIKRHGLYQLDIINTFSNNINIDMLGRKNYSTKNRNSGLGLNYILNKNSGIKIKFSIIDDLFQTSIYVKEK